MFAYMQSKRHRESKRLTNRERQTESQRETCIAGRQLDRQIGKARLTERRGEKQTKEADG